MFGKKLYCFAALTVLCICGGFPVTAQAAPFKVLVIMSYEESLQWARDVREGTDSVLAGNCEVKYFYMDTKTNLEGGPQKAKDAYLLYQEFQPHGIIAVDDNAQSMFVVPYMKDKAKTPVIFCGVNAEPEKYGYPASNVSGILEYFPISMSIAYMQQLVPSIRTVGFISRDTPSGRAILGQAQKESDMYSAKALAFKTAKTLGEFSALTKELREQCDVLYTADLMKVPDENGKLVQEKDVISMLAKIFGKPTIGANARQVKSGILCSIIVTGQEQGETAGKMLLKAMQGTPLSQIPIVRNQKGKRFINVTVMRELGIRPQPRALLGANLVKTEK